MTHTAALKALAEGRLPAGTSRNFLPRLRFDRVARRLVRDLQAVLAGAVPEQAAVIVTVTAPIRLPARTVAAVNMRIRDHLAGGATDSEFDETICGNGVRARIVRSNVREAPKVIVFVCNPEPPPEGLLELAEALLA
jgi:hypothetical protein